MINIKNSYIHKIAFIQNASTFKKQKIQLLKGVGVFVALWEFFCW